MAKRDNRNAQDKQMQPNQQPSREDVQKQGKQGQQQNNPNKDANR